MSSTQETHDDDPNPGLILRVVPRTFGICRLSPEAKVPFWIRRSIFSSVSRSPDELSIVCEDELVPEDVRCQRGWKAIRVMGTLDLSLIGVLASMAVPLADARIGLFTVSTYDTDYLMVRETKLEQAIAVLEAAGHNFDRQPGVPHPAEEAPSVPPLRAPRPQEAEPVHDEAPLSAEAASAEAASAEAASTDEIAANERPAAKPSAPKRAIARVLAEFGFGTKDEPGATADDEPRAVEPRAVEPRAVAPREQADLSAPVAAPSAWPRAQDLGKPATAVPDVAELEKPADSVDSAAEEPVPAPTWVAAEPSGEEDEGAQVQGLFTGAIPQHPVEVSHESFEDLGLSEPILKTVREVGFEHPTPIQAKVIPVALEGHDVIGLAETGSGKTAAFCLPMAERLTHGRGIRGLILCPTREIALQTKAFLDIFGRDHELETVAVIGGVRMGPQISGLKRTPDIIVATPGRLADHARRRNVSLGKIEELVLDEADHMLDLGFLPQIREIVEQIPENRRTMMFSATMPPPIERLAQQFMREPARLDIRPVGQLASGIEHRLYLVKEEDRKDCLFALLQEVEGSTLIFVRRKLHTEWLARQLELAGFAANRIHSDRTQAQRVQALRGFREGKFRILAATDVAARGIDVPRIQHVINFGLPEHSEDYVHRAGRTARGNAVGVVSSIGTWQDKITVHEIEIDLGIVMPRCTVEGVEPYVELVKRKTVRRRRLL